LNIITRGLGLVQQLITQGFSYVIEIITPTKVTTYKGSGYGGGPIEDDFKKVISTAIKTNSIKLRDPSFKIQVRVTFSKQPSLKVLAKLEKIIHKNKQFELKITIL